MKKVGIASFFLGALLQGTCLGGEFQNLGFDGARVQLSFPGQYVFGVDPTNALPGWTLSSAFDILAVNGSTYDGSVDWAILGDSFSVAFSVGVFVEGRFALSLFRSRVDSPIYKFAQTGTVPPPGAIPDLPALRLANASGNRR